MEQKTSCITLPPNGKSNKERIEELRAQVNGIRYDSAKKTWETSATAYGDITTFAKQAKESIVQLLKDGRSFKSTCGHSDPSLSIIKNS